MPERRHVGLVERSSDLAAFLDEHLRALGLDVTVAADLAALERLVPPPDVVLVNLPRPVDLADLARRITTAMGQEALPC